MVEARCFPAEWHRLQEASAALPGHLNRGLPAPWLGQSLTTETTELTNRSVVLSATSDRFAAIPGPTGGAVLLAVSGDKISLVSRKGFVDTGLMELFSEIRLRKGFLDAREVGPRSVGQGSVMALKSTTVSTRDGAAVR